MLKDFYSLLHNIYKEIEFKTLDYYVAKKEENNNLPSLDYCAREFLSKFYQTTIETKEQTDFYLALWKYEALLHNIKHAKDNTDYYKNICSQAHIDIDSLIHELKEKKARSSLVEKSLTKESLTELFLTLTDKLPFSTSQDLERNSEAFLAVSSEHIIGVSSLDPTGKLYQVRDIDKNIAKQSNAKKRIYYSSVDLSSMLLYIFFGIQDIVKRQDAKVLLMMSPGKAKSAGVFFSTTMQKLGVDCKAVVYSTDCEHIAKIILDYKANVLFGVPWNLHALSAYIKSNNIKHNIETVILNGDTASQSMRKQISENLDCEVFLHYGMTEIGFGGAAECRYHDGLHLRMLDIAVEIVDENLQKVEDGIDGEIVITTLTRQAIPLIRYRTGDRGRIVPSECECCSSMQRIHVHGFAGQGVSITQDKFIHLTDFQDFFYSDFQIEENKDKEDSEASPAILDFEMCFFKDLEKNLNCLLIGLDMSHKEEHERNLLLQCMRSCFEQYFNILDVEHVKVNSFAKESEDIEAFYICTKEEYDAILKKNAEKLLVEGGDFENSREQDMAFALAIKRLDTFFTAKKMILSFSGKLFDE